MSNDLIECDYWYSDHRRRGDQPASDISPVWVRVRAQRVRRIAQWFVRHYTRQHYHLSIIGHVINEHWSVFIRYYYHTYNNDDDND